jgi:hypothetical protein
LAVGQGVVLSRMLMVELSEFAVAMSQEAMSNCRSCQQKQLVWGGMRLLGRKVEGQTGERPRIVKFLILIRLPLRLVESQVSKTAKPGPPVVWAVMRRKQGT